MGTLEALMLEGDLLEVSMDETQHIWRVLQATEPRRSKRYPDLDRLEEQLENVREEKIKAVQGKDMTDQVRNNKIEERERIVKVASKKKSKKIVRPIPNVNGQQAKRYIGYNVMDANFGFIYIALVSNQNRSQRTKISFVKLVNPTVKTRGKRGRTTKNNLA